MSLNLQLMTTVIVKVIEARNLAPKDWSGKSDPYFIVAHSKTSCRSKVVKQTLDPVWNASFDLRITQATMSDDILITFWDKDLLRSEYLGHLVLPTSECISVKFESSRAVWYLLVTKETSCSS
jgi:Ca2+-dependent lipid-binding protein